ncbi:ECs_2282 family putative zinc-binding protein [Serratia sp. L9]|uniref:ECs_2282 family putative zinc-binding protein n=1 Tax=Serratia sp. L9 TaxID=3423946 RepID=UPI003D66F2E4
MENVNFSCPECGCEVFDTAAISEHPDSFAGAICADCGHVVTEDETLEGDEKIFDDLVGILFK